MGVFRPRPAWRRRPAPLRKRAFPAFSAYRRRFCIRRRKGRRDLRAPFHPGGRFCLRILYSLIGARRRHFPICCQDQLPARVHLRACDSPAGKRKPLLGGAFLEPKCRLFPFGAELQDALRRRFLNPAADLAAARNQISAYAACCILEQKAVSHRPSPRIKVCGIRACFDTLFAV